MSEPPMRISSSIGSSGVEAPGPEELIVPGILANGERKPLIAQGIQILAFRRIEIALFVKNVIERQKPLGLDKLDGAVAQECRGVHDVFS